MRKNKEYSNHRVSGFYELPGRQSKEGNTMGYMFLLPDSGALINRRDLLISTFIKLVSPQFTRLSYFFPDIESHLDGFRKPVLRSCVYLAMSER